MIRVLLGSIAGALASFIVGFLLWSTPLASIGYSNVGDPQTAAVQQALAANLPHTGRYVVPEPGTPGGTILYGRGPVATVDYNSAGYPVIDTAALIGAFIVDLIAALLIALPLFAVAGQVTRVGTRLRLAFGITAAATVLTILGGTITIHGDWRFTIYAFIADLAMLWAAAFVIVRWFLPKVPAQP